METAAVNVLGTLVRAVMGADPRGGVRFAEDLVCAHAVALLCPDAERGRMW